MTNLIISTLDHQRIIQRISQAKANSKIAPAQIMNLLRGFDGATLVEPVRIPVDVVTMNSLICVEYLDSAKTRNIRLVYPEEADGTQNHTSIFAPLATALLGCKLGTLIHLRTPSGSVKVRINQILYQPEAAGNYTR